MTNHEIVPYSPASSREDLSVVATRINALADVFEITGGHRHSVARIVSRELGPVFVDALQSALAFGASDYDRAKELLKDGGPQVMTLNESWRQFAQSQEQSGSDLLNLLPLGFKTMYGTVEFSQRLMHLLLGSGNNAEVEKWTKALMDFLCGVAPEPVDKKKTNQRNFLGLPLFASNSPRPLEIMYQLAGATGQAGEKSVFLKALLSKMAVGATAVVAGRRALVRAENDGIRESRNILAPPNRIIQTAGGQLKGVLEQLRMAEEKKAALLTEISSAVPKSTAEPEPLMKAAAELVQVENQVLTLQVRESQLRGQMEVGVDSLKSGIGISGFISASLNTIRMNIGGISRSLLFANETLGRVSVDVYMAMVLTANAQSAVEKRNILQKYQERIKQLPASIIKAINEPSPTVEG